MGKHVQKLSDKYRRAFADMHLELFTHDWAMEDVVRPREKFGHGKQRWKIGLKTRKRTFVGENGSQDSLWRLHVVVLYFLCIEVSLRFLFSANIKLCRV